METGGKQTNSCHLPRVLEEVPFTARNVTRSEVSQEAACRGREAGSRARIRGAEQGKGPDVGGPRPSYPRGWGWAKSPWGEMYPKAGRAPLYRKTCISACLQKIQPIFSRSQFLWHRCGNHHRDWPLIGMGIINREE